MRRHPIHPYMRMNKDTFHDNPTHHQERDENYWHNHPFAQEEPEAEEPALQEDSLSNTDLPDEEKKAQEAAPENDASAENKEDSKKELEELRLRTAAEMDNFKKRLNREHQEQMRYASEKVLGDLLPTLDNLDLALQYGSQNEACKDMLDGVAMTRKLLLDAVTKHGLTALGENGEEFNPQIHEAVGFESAPDMPSGAVSRVLQRGYKLNDRLLRPAKVMINQ